MTAQPGTDQELISSDPKNQKTAQQSIQPDERELQVFEFHWFRNSARKLISHNNRRDPKLVFHPSKIVSRANQV